MSKDELGSRMKAYYEEIPKTKLMRRTPVAIRLDGKAFHTFTRGFQKPFDEVLVKSMQQTMKYLCKNIQGCVFGYTQSDEITLLLVDYKKLNSDAWFDYEVQKMCSISASMATMAFNKFFESNVREWSEKEFPMNYLGHCVRPIDETFQSTIDIQNRYIASLNKGAMFDARVFNIPKEEATNLIYWRQIDATRNSIQMAGQHYFSHGELQHKSTSNIQDMLMEKYGINWNDYPTHLKRGSACKKAEGKWYIDYEMPILKGVGRTYVDNEIYCQEEE